jgi:membrane-bound serine protease (ClpP class)
MARLVILLTLVLGLLDLQPTNARAALVHVVPVEGPIGPATSDLIGRSIDRAAEAGADLVVLRMDTPGGLDTSMRSIIRAIIEAPVPVATYVAPSGARAASAGTFILYASHIAAMAPGTNLGAATPVAIGGSALRLQTDAPANGESGDSSEGGDDSEGGATAPAEEPEAAAGDDDTAAERTPSEAKAIEDAAAYIRSLAEMRGRDPDFAERAVREAKSMTYREALDAGVIDLVARNLDALLDAVDGREIELERGTVVLQTAGATVEQVQPDWRYQLLAIITNPNVAAILMLIGVYGIIFEFYSPGLVGPGLIGAICLLLGLYAFQVLPVSYAGVALLILGTVLVVAEAFVPSFGILGITGVAAFTAGAILLMDTDVPGFGISPYIVGALALSLSGLFLFTLTMVLRGRDRPVVTGPEAVAHGHGEVVSWQRAEGQVRLEGEIWHAEGPEHLSPGARVAVTSRDGLTLTVEPEQSRN